MCTYIYAYLVKFTNVRISNYKLCAMYQHKQGWQSERVNCTCTVSMYVNTTFVYLFIQYQLYKVQSSLLDKFGDGKKMVDHVDGIYPTNLL
jgi:hypothetical protein